VSAFRRRCEAESRGHSYQVGQRIRLHLFHNLTSVCLHRDLADAELATDLFIQQAGDHQCHDLPFARGERRVTVAKRLYLRLATKCSVAALELYNYNCAKISLLRTLGIAEQGVKEYFRGK